MPYFIEPKPFGFGNINYQKKYYIEHPNLSTELPGKHFGCDTSLYICYWLFIQNEHDTDPKCNNSHQLIL